MSGQDTCEKCGESLSGDGYCHNAKCPTNAKLTLVSEPQMMPMEGSEVEGMVDCSAICLDSKFRPIHVSDDEGNVLAITVSDARRLLKFLNEAIPYIDEMANARRQ